MNPVDISSRSMTLRGATAKSIQGYTPHYMCLVGWTPPTWGTVQVYFLANNRGGRSLMYSPDLFFSPSPHLKYMVEESSVVRKRNWRKSRVPSAKTPLKTPPHVLTRRGRLYCTRVPGRLYTSYSNGKFWPLGGCGKKKKKEERKERKKERKERKKKVFPLKVGFRNYILFGCFLGITVAIY